MATVNQIYQIVNDAAGQALGTDAITAVNTGTFVSLGDQILQSDTNVDLFYKALTDRIGLTVVAIREYKAKYRSVFRRGMDWGAIYQKISFSMSDARENPTWIAGKQASPFDVEGSIKATQKLFSQMGTWSNEEVIPDVQLKTAFLNPEGMNAFIDGIFVAMKNSMELEIERLSALAVNTNIAGCLIKGNASMKRNLLFEYNYKMGNVDSDNVAIEGKTPLTLNMALTDMPFLKFASREIKLAVDNITSYSKIFNAESQARHTPRDRAVLEVLAQYASAAEFYLQADTFHNEITSLPMYERVTYWQGSGEQFSFEDCSTVYIENSSLATTGNDTGEINQSGIIAFLHDIDSCASTMYDRRTTSMYNPRSEVNIYMEKATVGYAVDMSENAIVFYLGEATTA